MRLSSALSAIVAGLLIFTLLPTQLPLVIPTGKKKKNRNVCSEVSFSCTKKKSHQLEWQQEKKSKRLQKCVYGFRQVHDKKKRKQGEKRKKKKTS